MREFELLDLLSENELDQMIKLSKTKRDRMNLQED